MGALQALAFPNGIGDGQQFSAAPTTLNVDLANSDPGVSNYNIYQIGNVVPANSPAYAPAGGLVTSYATFLDWVQLQGDVNPNLQSQINLAAGNLTTAENNFLTVQTNAFTAWANFKTASGSSVAFSTWAVQNYPVYQSAYNALIGAQSSYSQLLNQAYGPGYSELQAARNKVGVQGGAADITLQNPYNMVADLVTIAPPGSGSSPVLPGQTPPPSPQTLVSTFVPSYTLEAFGAKYSEWQTASVQGKNNAGGTITVTAASETFDYSEFGWNASVDASWLGDFFEIGGSGSSSGQRVSINTTSSNFSLSVAFTGFGVFSISPGLWWDNASLIDLYKNSLRTGAPDFFGPTGALARLPYSIVVGFEPTITLKMEASDYSNVKNTWQAQASVSIGVGPFTLGSASVSTYGTKQNIKWDDASATVTIGPVTSTLPILLGVMSQQLGS